MEKSSNLKIWAFLYNYLQTRIIFEYIRVDVLIIIYYNYQNRYINIKITIITGITYLKGIPLYETLINSKINSIIIF